MGKSFGSWVEIYWLISLNLWLAGMWVRGEFADRGKVVGDVWLGVRVGEQRRRPSLPVSERSGYKEGGGWWEQVC